MVDRIRRAGAVSWALCGVAALVALIGLVAWVLRVIWPPLILAGAIVFLLTPVVTRLARRPIPRALGTPPSSLELAGVVRSEERRVGIEWGGTCRARWSRYR